jgi:hypothetical protein
VELEQIIPARMTFGLCKKGLLVLSLLPFNPWQEFAVSFDAPDASLDSGLLGFSLQFVQWT